MKKLVKYHALSVFPALKNRNFRLYFAGQLISLIGTWLQIVAEGWLVLQLTNSAFLIGLVAALATFPTLIFSLFGGVIVDRFPKKKIIILTQAASMILAFILGILTVLQLITVWEICIIAFSLGVVNALDFPARQAFTAEMVEKEELASAIAINAGIFNGARVIGPSVAGILIAVVGTGGAFILNGASYVAVIVALLLIRVKEVRVEEHVHPIQAIKEGLFYSFTHPFIKTLLIFTGFVSIFGWSYGTILPLIAKNNFHVGADGLGFLYAAAGLGALLATFVVSLFAKKVSPLGFIIGGTFVFGISMIGFTFTSNLKMSLPFLFFAGFGLLSTFSTLNTTLHHMVENKYRGRVMSLYLLVFVGFFPFGNFQIGFFSEHFGPQFAIRLGALIVLAASIVLYFLRTKVRKEHKKYRGNLAS